MNNVFAPARAPIAARFLGTVVLVTSLALGGCDRPTIEEQQEPKSTAIESATPAPQPASPSPEDAASAPSGDAADPAARSGPAPSPRPSEGASEWPWRVPESWQFVAEERPMRLATYVVQGPEGPVEIAISRFPGDVGGMLANVNRWRGQVGLPPTTEAELDGMIERFQSPGFEGALLHIKGAEQHIVVASLYEASGDRTWTVRMSGTESIATSVREELFEFARSFGRTDE
jgi:hypothetical protein